MESAYEEETSANEAELVASKTLSNAIESRTLELARGEQLLLSPLEVALKLPQTWGRPGPGFSEPAKMVTFIVSNGQEQDKFVVHKEFACAYSPALKAAFNSDFQEGLTQTYKYDDINPVAFGLLVQWMYTQKFDVFDYTKVPRSSKKLDIFENEFQPRVVTLWKAQDMNFVQLWVLADRLMIPKLQNDVMRHLEGMWHVPGRDWASIEWISWAYENSSSNSPLRKLAVDQFVFIDIDDPNWAEKHPELFPKKFLLDFAFRVKKNTDTEYHEPEDKWPVIETYEICPRAYMVSEGKSKK